MGQATAPSVLMGLALLCSPVLAQDAGIVASLSADTVGVAEVFELRVRLPIPAGSVVYFADTVPATPEVESFAPVVWRAERGRGGGAVLTLAYPLIPFGAGTVSVTGPDVVVVREGIEADGERVPGGSVVAPWSERPRATASTISRTTVPAQALWVEPVYTADDVVRGVSPRPPADVLGFGWSWPSVALLLLFSSVLAGAVVSTTGQWLGRRVASAPGADARPLTLEEARLRAVAELDALAASGPAGQEDMPALYTASSGIVRRYVERLDGGWGPDLTSGELMRRLAERSPVDRPFVDEMRTAETVKFGRLRPSPPAAGAHLSALRTWLVRTPEADG